MATDPITELIQSISDNRRKWPRSELICAFWACFHESLRNLESSFTRFKSLEAPACSIPVCIIRQSEKQINYASIIHIFVLLFWGCHHDESGVRWSVLSSNSTEPVRWRTHISVLVINELQRAEQIFPSDASQQSLLQWRPLSWNQEAVSIGSSIHRSTSVWTNFRNCSA